MKLNRNQWILLALLVFLLGEVGYHIYRHWGLVTIHSKTTPLAQVIRSIEKQGHVTIKTNMDLNKPVYMNVDEVTLSEALETLATVMDGGWRLTYVIGPDKGAVAGAVATMSTGQRTEGWKMLYVRLPGFGDDNSLVLADPRKDPWVVKPAKEATLQSYLQEASRNVSASFLVQSTFNPAVKSPPRSGAITSSLSRLASAANAKYEEVVFLQAAGGRFTGGGERDRGPDRGGEEPRFAGNPGGGPGGRGGFDREAMEERIENELNKLPPAERLAAQQERDERKKMFDDMKDLTPEQKQQRFQDIMSTPDMQDKMENQMAKQNNRQSPQQRIARAQKYLGKLAAARQAQGKQ